MFIRFYYSLLVTAGLIYITMVPNHAYADALGIKNTLSTIEIYAEKMVDASLKKDGLALASINKNIQQSIDVLHNKLSAQAFDERRSRELLMAYSWTRIISIDIQQQAWIGVAIAANQLTASMIRVTNYPNLQKRDLEWMDYLAREILLLNMEGPKENRELLRARYTDLQSTWHRISNKLIINFRNKPLVLKGDALILQMKNPDNVENIISTAKKILVFVRKLENL
jgi:hypothetical protein